jgi:uncharacterized protein YyaL (SSP411 family)
VEQTLDFVRRELTSPAGGFYSSLDADSEGEEGRFYLWTPQQVQEVLGTADGSFFCEIYDVTPRGNFEGRSIPNLLPASLAGVRPATDDKVLTAWNGLMISAMARAHQALGRAEDLRSAERAAAFVLEHLAAGDALWVSWRAGHAALDAYLDDYAFLARGLLDLYEAGFDPAHLAEARRLALAMLERFEDPARGGFFFTAHGHEPLIARNRSRHDGALPSGAGVAAETLLRLAIHTDDARLRRAGERALEAEEASVARSPSAHVALLRAAAIAAEPAIEIAIVGAPDDPATGALLAAVRDRLRPRAVVQLGVGSGDPGLCRLLAAKTLVGGRPAAYVCRNYACTDPLVDPGALARRLAAD